MKNNIIIFFVGFTLGVCLVAFVWMNNAFEDSKYIQLEKDYRIGEAGFLKKGTTLRVDRGEDGFTRYILYLNLSDGEKTDRYYTKHKYTILPYWLYKEADSTK